MEKTLDKVKSFFVRLGQFFKTDAGLSFMSSAFAIFAGILFSFFLMLSFEPGDAFEGLGIILSAGFQEGMSSLGSVVVKATPLILTGLSVGFAFKTGLFNIGASGQLTMGAFAAIYIGVHWTIFGSFQWVIAVLGALLIGALWGLIPGLLKAFFNVHEVVASIMLNYIAMYAVVRLVQDYTFDSTKSESAAVNANAVIPKMGLDWIFPDSSVTGGFFLALAAVATIYIILQKTTFGYQLKAVGHNKDAAKYAGINDKMNIVYAMAISGALAGLAGAVVYLTSSGARISTTYILASEGFDGIAVALLGLSNPIGVLGAGIFIGYIKVAGLYLQTLTFKKEIIDIIISAIIYLSALSVVFKSFSKWLIGKISPFEETNANASTEEVKVSEGGDE